MNAGADRNKDVIRRSRYAGSPPTLVYLDVCAVTAANGVCSGSAESMLKEVWGVSNEEVCDGSACNQYAVALP